MIEDKDYKEILEQGLLLDHYFLLCNLKHGRKLVNTKRIQGFINLLTKKDFIREGVLTEKGLDLVENCVFSEKIIVPTAEESKKETDFGTWAAELHKKCQDKMFELVRQRQVKAKWEKRTYNFLCNVTDFAKVLKKAMDLYKLKDYERIEKAILGHIIKRNNENHWFPLMQYYIMKNGASQMVTDIENGVETIEDQDFKSSQKFI